MTKPTEDLDVETPLEQGPGPHPQAEIRTQAERAANAMRALVLYRIHPDADAAELKRLNDRLRLFQIELELDCGERRRFRSRPVRGAATGLAKAIGAVVGNR